jgi:hypothetical protein
LGNAELLRRFGHAAALNNRQEDMQVPQLQPTSDLALPIDLSRHRELPWGQSQMGNSDYNTIGVFGLTP